MMRKLAIAVTLAILGLCWHTNHAFAQSSTAGAITGRVADKSTGQPVEGAAVVAISPVLQGSQAAITDSGGAYKITNLPVGTYIVTFQFGNLTVQRMNIEVRVNNTTRVDAKLDQAQAGKKVTVLQKAPSIDTSKTSVGTRLGKDFLSKTPVPGRTFEAALTSTPGSAGDGLGVSFSGSSSLENQYVVDGVNTTNLTFGTVGSTLITDFIEEIEVISGGYNAEYGRATGGVVNVVTKTGTNEFKGSVFSYYTPGFLVADVKRAPREGFAMDVNTNLDYSFDFGFDLGGPIIKDKVWFYVGFAPAFSRNSITTIPKSRTDCREVFDEAVHGPQQIGRDSRFPTLTECITPAGRPDVNGGLGLADSVADEDPDSGFAIFDDLCNPGGGESSRPGCEVENDQSQIYQMVSKINFAVAPEHQGQFTFQSTPGTRSSVGVFGEKSAVNRDIKQFNYDVSFKWTSKFLDNKLETEAVVGWHHEELTAGSQNPGADDLRGQQLVFGTLGVWSRGNDPFGNPRERMETSRGCADSANFDEDAYPFIENCPDIGLGYSIGGPGGLLDDKSDRYFGKVGGTYRAEAAGKHEIKLGFDTEINTIDLLRELSGGSFISNQQGNTLVPDRNEIEITRWVRLAPPGATAEQAAAFDQECGPDPSDPNGMTNLRCQFLDTDRVDGETFNWSGYLRDSWQVLPKLTLNVGLRYEQQRMRWSGGLSGTRDPFTGNIRGKNAMVLDDLWAPRLGITYDWTKEGRSKLFAHWGRFYDNIPLRINERSFGSETLIRQNYNTLDPDQCGAADPNGNIGAPDGNGCTGTPQNGTELIGGSGVLIATDIKPQFLDELVLGVEYEIIEDLKLSLSFQNRRIGRVLEDISVDNAATYIFANPGEWSKDAEDDLKSEIEDLEAQIANTGAADMCDSSDIDSLACTRDRRANDLEQFQGIRTFDKPRRDYNSVTATVNRRFSQNFFAQASYTYSILEGNYPGKFSADTGQVDPNLTSQFDLIELLSNRDGRLPADRPHNFILDGYYVFDFKKAGYLVPGIRYRAISGTPIDALGRHYFYGFDESYLLPRGELGRTPFNHRVDLRMQYGRELRKGMKLEVFADVFSIFNQQNTAGVDETYTFSSANPVVGGDFRDLVFVKEVNQQGNQTSQAIRQNRNFRNTGPRYNPFSARFGVRLTF